MVVKTRSCMRFYRRGTASTGPGAVHRFRNLSDRTTGLSHRGPGVTDELTDGGCRRGRAIRLGDGPDQAAADDHAVGDSAYRGRLLPGADAEYDRHPSVR